MTDELLPPSEYQMEIFDFLLLHSWSQAMENYGIHSKRVIKTIILRSAYGLHWYPGHPGGPWPYLNHDKESRLLYMIEKAAEEQQCLSIQEVISLAFALKQQILIDARSSLLKRRCLKLAKSDETILPPSPTWVNKFVERHCLHSVIVRSMERERSFGCDRTKIIEYFMKFINVFNRDPRLIFGCDETDMKPGTRFKVVCPKDRQGFTSGQEESQKHISVMCCHSAGGASVPPLILLSDLKNLPKELSSMDINNPNVCWFVSTQKGYMTEESFYVWALLFVSWISGYRVSILPENIRCENILLIMDGCLAHKCPEALRLFVIHNITVLVLPAHTSHLLQAFDVVIAGSLKQYFRKFMIEEKSKQAEAGLSKAARTRLLLVRSFLRAWHAAASPLTCCRSFEAVGIFPICPTRVLNSPFVTDCSGDKLQDRFINNSIITDLHIIQKLEEESKRPFMPHFVGPSWTIEQFQFLIDFLKNQCPAKGRLLSTPPALFVPNSQGQWFLLKSFLPTAPPPLDQMSIIKIMRRLTVDTENRANNEINTFIQQRYLEQEELKKEVIQIISKKFAQEMSMKMTFNRIREIAPLFIEDFKNEMKRHIAEAVTNSNTDSSIKTTILKELDSISNSCLKRMMDLASST